MIRAGATTWLLVILASSLVACSAVLPEPGCSLTVAAVGDDPPVVGDPLPQGLPVIAGPDEIDLSATSLSIGDLGPELTIGLRGPAIDRLAQHTAGHIGQSLAIANGGTVVAVPFINASIEGGSMVISPASVDAGVFEDRLAGCRS
jgi:preprotein translocase subunit SecD